MMNSYHSGLKQSHLPPKKEGDRNSISVFDRLLMPKGTQMSGTKKKDTFGDNFREKRGSVHIPSKMDIKPAFDN